MSDSNQSIIDLYLYLQREVESPTSFLKWGAYSLISALLRSNVWIRFPNRTNKIPPNIYVLLNADSALHRKSNAIDTNARFLRLIGNTKVISGAASLQGVIKVLGHTENGKPRGGAGILLASELTAFFVNDPLTIQNLTALYDFNPHYDKNLASVEIAVVKDLCLGLFGGSNDTMLTTLFTAIATTGGLVGRTFIIHPDETRPPNSGFGPHTTKVKDSDWDPLERLLRDLVNVHGEVKMEPDAELRYHEWYIGLNRVAMHTGTGYEARIHTHVLKLCIILAASKPGFRQKDNTPRRVTIEEVERAIYEAQALLPVYKKMTLAVGRSTISHAMNLIVQTILNSPNHHISFMDIMIKHIGDLDKDLADQAIISLDASGLIIYQTKNGVPAYRATELLIERALGSKKKLGAVGD